jgi:hypothetical protein
MGGVLFGFDESGIGSLFQFKKRNHFDSLETALTSRKSTHNNNNKFVAVTHSHSSRDSTVDGSSQKKTKKSFKRLQKTQKVTVQHLKF